MKVVGPTLDPCTTLALCRPHLSLSRIPRHVRSWTKLTSQVWQPRWLIGKSCMAEGVKGLGEVFGYDGDIYM